MEEKKTTIASFRKESAQGDNSIDQLLDFLKQCQRLHTKLWVNINSSLMDYKFEKLFGANIEGALGLI